jgi:hypothetical protein
MPKIVREPLTLFGRDGDSSNFTQYGSRTAGSTVFTKDIPTIQQLSAWTDGWQEAVFPVNSAPFLEDVNALFYVLAYEIFYILQEGIPEWDANTTYWIDSIVKKAGTGGQQFRSLQDNNTGNVPPTGASNAFWAWINPPPPPPSFPPVATRQVLTSGAGATYFTPVNVRQLRIRMIAGGGGGGAGDGATNGAVGGNSIFNSINAAGGGAGLHSAQAGAAAGGTGGAGSASFRGSGGPSGEVSNTFSQTGSQGGNSLLGGGATPTLSVGNNAIPNSGGGGAGASYGNGNLSASGGGGGEYVELIINSPSSSYIFTVGAGGLGGTPIVAGGNGGSGVIIVDELY